MTPFELTKKMQTLRELLGAATPGPWIVGEGYEQSDPGTYIASTDGVGPIVCAQQDGTDCPLRKEDAALIAEARNALPVLLAEIERCWDKLERVRLWTFEGGKSLSPRGADTYGEGKRDAKQEVSRILSAETNR